MNPLPALGGLAPRGVSALLALLLLVLALPPLAASEPADPAPRATSPPPHPGWEEEAIELADGLPVQEGGRVKPLITYAGYTLLALNSRKSVQASDGRWIGPTEWLLDMLFFPGVAAHYRVFLVQDDATLDAIGFTREMREAAAEADYAREGQGHKTRKKRDRWSFADLMPAFEGLVARAEEYRKTPREARSRVQAQVLTLSENVQRYLALVTSMQSASGRLTIPRAPALQRIFGEATSASFSQVLGELEALHAALPPPSPEGVPPPKPSEEQRAIYELLLDLGSIAGAAAGPALLPQPPGASGADRDTWRNPRRILDAAAAEGEVPTAMLDLLKGFERVGDALGDRGATLSALRTLHADLVRAAEARGEYERVPLEVTYQRLDPVSLSWKLYFVGLTFALLAFLSLRGRWGRVLRALAWILVAGGAAVLVTGIVMRCVIMSRPPVATLYETILFITATGSLACFVVEALSRRWIALPVAGVVGTLGLLLAQWFEGLNKQDTMPTLEAVLATNFWLSTHVTTVTFGYSAGLLAAILGQVYVLGRVFGIGKKAHETYAAIGRTVYGVVCFGLLLSLVGTILGGIWANDSWGRFWGWDPKENGALMICLWELMLLHLRLGGYVGPFGFCMLAVAGGAVVAWSWWGVNQLGVGLHSYGFTEGIQTMLDSIYLWLGAVLLLGLAWRFVKGPGSLRRT